MSVPVPSPAALDAARPFLAGWCAILGLLVGSFLNVVVYRVPAGLSVVRPRSACPSCSHPIRSFDNIPVLSWLVLRGRCRDCQAPISWRYPAVEALTGAVFAALAALFGFSPATPFLLWAAAAGIALVLIDLDCLRLPDKVVAHVWGAALAGTAALALTGAGTDLAVRAGLSGLAWAVPYVGIWFGTGGRAMGFGDVKLAPALGVLCGWFGWGASAIGWFGGFALGGVVGIALMVAGRAGRKTKVPFGPYLIVGAFAGMLVGQALFGAYLRLFGL